ACIERSVGQASGPDVADPRARVKAGCASRFKSKIDHAALEAVSSRGFLSSNVYVTKACQDVVNTGARFPVLRSLRGRGGLLIVYRVDATDLKNSLNRPDRPDNDWRTISQGH